ncbi:MAG: RNA polymerase sigma factor [Pseudomonadota bacterium]
MRAVRTAAVAMNTTSDSACDMDLLAAIARQDVRAFERLYRRYFRKIVGFAARMTSRTDLAEEIASETVLAIWRGAGSYQGTAKPSTWIFGIAYRQALAALRRSDKDRRSKEVAEVLHENTAAPDEVERLFLRDELGKALLDLSPEHRAVVELTYVYGYTSSEISEIIDCPVGTVKTRLMHARRKLKTKMSAPESPGMEDGQ